ncbi:unnamed protein product [Leuciscus chuanchicus]
MRQSGDEGALSGYGRSPPIWQPCKERQLCGGSRRQPARIITGSRAASGMINDVSGVKTKRLVHLLRQDRIWTVMRQPKRRQTAPPRGRLRNHTHSPSLSPCA